jgi:hypothetical protein
MTKTHIDVAKSILEDSWLLYNSDHDGWLIRNKLKEMVDRLHFELEQI